MLGGSKQCLGLWGNSLRQKHPSLWLADRWCLSDLHDKTMDCDWLIPVHSSPQSSVCSAVCIAPFTIQNHTHPLHVTCILCTEWPLHTHTHTHRSHVYKKLNAGTAKFTVVSYQIETFVRACPIGPATYTTYPLFHYHQLIVIIIWKLFSTSCCWLNDTLISCITNLAFLKQTFL